MPSSTWTVTVRRSPEQVFEYLADVHRHAEWSPKPYHVEGLAAGPVQAGTKFRSVGWIPRDSNHVNDVEVIECTKPQRLVLASHDQDQVFTNTFSLTPADGGTRIERTMDMPQPSGALALLFPVLLRTVVRPGVQKGMNMLRDNLENEAPQPAAAP